MWSNTAIICKREKSHLKIWPHILSSPEIKYHEFFNNQARLYRQPYSYNSKYQYLISSPPASTAPSGPGPPHYRGFTTTLRHTTPGRTSLDEWSAPHRPLPDNTQHSNETDTHAPGGIRTRNPSKRAAADPRLRPCGHWDRQQHLTLNNISISLYVFESNTAMFSWR